MQQGLSYDPWGRLRNPQSQSVYEIGNEVVLVLGGRGFTGHEHLTSYGLINMNARLYDPAVGRFLSPDPYVQSPDFSQSFNRYSYCWNNPLRYNDLTGEWLGIDDLVAGIIGGVINLGVNIWQGNLHGTPWQMIGQGAGAVAGDLALYGPVGWAVGGALVGATNAALSGETGIGILKGGGIGAASSLVGGYAGQFAASSLGAVTVNGFRITSPVIKGTVGGLAGGAGGGYASGFTVGYLTTGDLEQANEMGLSGMKSGAIMGTLSGAGAGYKYAKDYNLDWKTGTPIYPSNNGAVLGSTTNEYLMPNTKIDRYGGDQGYFFSEPGTPISSRSLPPNNSGVYNQYEVLKPIPVQKSIITPWFGQPGGGVQYQTPVPVRVLIDKGFIIKY